MARLSGKTAIITGAAQGIGLATARCFAAEGARVVLTDIQEQRGRDAAAELTGQGLEAIFLRADVTDAGSISDMVAATVAHFGPPDVLVNNAGIAVFRDPLEMTETDWKDCFAVDLDGAWTCSRAVLPHMLATGRGDIINIASVHSFKIIPHCFPYPIAKHGVIGLTRALAVEYGERNIRVNAIAPGYVATEIVETIFARSSDPDLREKTDRLQPVRRIGRPEEIGWAAVFLASDECRFLTGECMVIDGGRSTVFHD